MIFNNTMIQDLYPFYPFYPLYLLVTISCLQIELLIKITDKLIRFISDYIKIH